MAEPARALVGPTTGRAIRIEEQPGRTILQVNAFHGRAAAVARALGSGTGLEPMTEVGGTVEGDGLAILTGGPGRFWLMGEGTTRVEVDPALALTVDQSHGRVVVAVAGERVRGVLAKGCRMDVHPAAFPAGRCAQTSLGPFAVLLHCREAERFEIHVARSYAESLREWLTDAALEFESAAAG